MSAKNKLKWFIFIVLIVIMSYFYYQYHYSNTGIYRNILDRNGYALHLKKEQISIELFVKPEWIPFHSDGRIEPKVKIAELYNTSFWLDEVWNRGDDIAFSFTTSFRLDYSEGNLLYNGYLNGDGSYTTPSGEVRLYDSDGNDIPLGQWGTGPGAAFGFGINPEYHDLIREGFYVRYNGYNLYSYVK